MIRILVPLVLFFLIVLMTRRYLNNATLEEKKSRQTTVLLIGFAIVMLVLALMGRLHWLGVLLAAIVPFARMAFTAAIDIYRQKKLHEYAAQKKTIEPSVKLSKEEALKILGLKEPYTPDEVIQAHRKLIQKLHPDRGGNDFLASQINEAKKKLLNP